MIAGLPIQYVLTTNYDRLMETAFQVAGKSPKVTIYDIDGNRDELDATGDENSPLVYKLHGSVDDPRTMLCTEDDIVQFLACVYSEIRPSCPAFASFFVTTLFCSLGMA